MRRLWRYCSAIAKASAEQAISNFALYVRSRAAVHKPISDAVDFAGPDPLIVLAHPDDECIALGIFLQRCSNARVLFLTSGEAAANFARLVRKGRSPFFREEETYAAHRLLTRSKIVGFERFPDGQLYRCLAPAATRLIARLSYSPPSALLTHAFEGGHPDHDCCSFLANRVGNHFGLPVWEFPEYSAPPRSLVQKFARGGTEGVIRLEPTWPEVSIKRQMFALHRSQRTALRRFNVAAPESFRLQAAHDYWRKSGAEYFSDLGYTADVVAEAYRESDQSFRFDFLESK